MQKIKQRCLPVLLALALTVGLTACGDDAEERYQAALSELQNAKSERQAALDEVQERKDEFAEAQKELNEAKNELAKAREEVLEAQQAAQRVATDTTIFQLLQEKYVSDSSFEDSRIAVLVDGGIVTLRGYANDNETIQMAIKVAKGTAGVQNVVNQLALKVEQKPAE